MIDTDNSGTITFDEPKDGLKSVGSELMKSEIRALMDAVWVHHEFRIQSSYGCAETLYSLKWISVWLIVLDLSVNADIDNSGTIDYVEFLAATVHLNKMKREENLVSAFSFFDKDGSGY
ncbi:hypothetical protein H6P81_009806 [Aristolochia fimbriata]|uniref:EF-hand domain-containing protein n=1 Tax=Aristolochia fimbriata TaxID=158543 RepID=A0AAV7EN12_ARIFI|nr:hypothetical protein H6P81_009806 [Aristolochia fimbriata]